MSYQEDLIKRENELTQQIIKRHKLNKVEAFYVFNSDERTMSHRLNEIFEIRGEPWFFPDEEQNDEDLNFDTIELEEDWDV